MSTIESSKNSPSLAERFATALGKMRVLRDVTSWQLLRRGMKSEQDMAERDMEAYHQLIHGDRAGEKRESDEMGDQIVFGDYRVDQRPANVPKTGGKFLKLLAGGGLLVSGLGTGLAVPLLIDAVKPEPVIVQPQEPETIIEEKTKTFDFEVGDPIVR